MYKKKISVIIVSCLILLVFDSCSRKRREDKQLMLTPPDLVLELYQLMKDVHELFEKNKIEYWVDGGTLLGAKRHKGIIPWDDDLDIALPQNEVEKLKAIKDQLEDIGYELEEHSGIGYKIYKKELFKGSRLFVDVFLMIETNGAYFYELPELWGKRDGGPLYIRKDEIQERMLVPFGAFKVYAPTISEPYLDALYGPKWFRIGYQTHMHHQDLPMHVKVELTDEDRVPAEPQGPLQDRVN